MLRLQITTFSFQTSEDIEIVLAGNKLDLEETSREVQRSVVQQYAEEEGFYFTETSAKNDKNVNDAFLYIVLKLFERFESGKSMEKVNAYRAFDASESKVEIADDRSYPKLGACDSVVLERLQSAMYSEDIVGDKKTSYGPVGDDEAGKGRNCCK